MYLFFRVVASAFLFICCASALLAQTAAPAKIALINTDLFFNEKTGITKLVGANKQIDSEFAGQIKTLQDSGTKIQAIAGELENMQKLPPAAFNQTAYAAKRDEGEGLQRIFTRKKAELEEAIEKRRKVLIAPINTDIGNGITEFAKKNGFGAIFDVSKLGESGALLFLSPSADVTREFITFYNARPAPVTRPK